MVGIYLFINYYQQVYRTQSNHPRKCPHCYDTLKMKPQILGQERTDGQYTATQSRSQQKILLQMKYLNVQKQSRILRNDISLEYTNKKNEFIARIKALPDTVEMNLTDGFYIGQIDSNQQRNGKGLFKYHGNIYFGGWKDDFFHGQGIYIFHSGEIYDGLLSKGMKQGHGVYYYNEAEAYYDGQWKNDERYGIGVFSSVEEYYEGQWENGNKEGNGHHLNRVTNDSYVGEFRHNKKCGKGRMIYGDGSVYSGDFYHDLPHGQGQLEFVNKDTYKGEFKQGRRQRKGIYFYSQGSFYEGIWQNNLKVIGELTLFNGDIFSGSFRNNQRLQGVYHYKNGDIYQGTWSQDVKHGKGTLKLAKGQQYVGQFSDGEKHGYGVYTWSNGDSYDGEFINDKRNGLGTYFWQDGGYYKGQWKDDRMNGIGKLVKQRQTIFGEFFADHLSRKIEKNIEGVLFNYNEEAAQYILSRS